MYSQTWSSNCLQYYFPGEKKRRDKEKKKKGERRDQNSSRPLLQTLFSRRLLRLVLLWPWKSWPHLRTFAPTRPPSRAWLSCQFPANEHEVGVGAPAC